MTATVDALIIGGGIAGVSAGFFLAERGRSVVVVESEAQLAYHTTGRSAALFFENYGAGPVRPLTKASRGFLDDPPPGLADAPLLHPRGALTIARPDQADRLEAVRTAGEEMGADVRRLSPEQAAALVPVLRSELLAGALWEPGAADMDVAGIHQAFVRGMRRAGGEIRTSWPVTSLTRAHGGEWRAAGEDGEIRSHTVVDAAGAWGDVVAAMAGVSPVGLTPRRRTAFMVPGHEEWRDWPLVVDVDHDFYFKPDGVQLLCSPADETPSDPCDARPEEVDIALAIDRINEATTIGIRTVRSAWAGLRTFSPDESMVIGFDPDVPGFFWLVGQGGTGIQTAPGAGRLAAALVAGEEPPEDMTTLGLDLGRLLPHRLR